MRRAILRCLLLSLAVVPSAGAEVRVLDTATGASHTLLRDGRLIGFTDAAAVIVRRRGRVLRVDIADRHVTRLRHLERELESVAPGARSAELTRERAGAVRRRPPRRRRPHDRQLRLRELLVGPEVAWSHDAARVAIVVAPLLR